MSASLNLFIIYELTIWSNQLRKENTQIIAYANKLACLLITCENLQNLLAIIPWKLQTLLVLSDYLFSSHVSTAIIQINGMEFRNGLKTAGNGTLLDLCFILSLWNKYLLIGRVWFYRIEMCIRGCPKSIKSVQILKVWQWKYTRCVRC